MWDYHILAREKFERFKALASQMTRKRTFKNSGGIVREI